MRNILFFLAACSILNLSAETYKIGFGSCLDQRNTQDIFFTIKNEGLDHFIFLGDNVYGDAPWTGNLNKLIEAYRIQKTKLPAWLSEMQIDAIWDDHDYGLNDGGKNFTLKAEAQDLFLNFWDIPRSDPRHSREGIYFSKTLNIDNKRVKIIALDTRYFRSDLKGQRNQYQPNLDSDATILGSQQWEWLKNEVAEPADLILLLSSIQILATQHRFEKWSNFPAEREKLLKLINESPNAANTILISGDRHRGALYKSNATYELTASALNKVASQNVELDPLLIDQTFPELNYGIVEIDSEDNLVKIFLKDINGDILVQGSINI
jgi:alkaline phosphatase D